MNSHQRRKAQRAARRMVPPFPVSHLLRHYMQPAVNALVERIEQDLVRSIAAYGHNSRLTIVPVQFVPWNAAARVLKMC